MPKGKVRPRSNTSLRFFLMISVIAMFSWGWLLAYYYGNSEPAEFSGIAFDESSDQKWLGKLSQLSSPNHADGPVFPYSVIEGRVQNVDGLRNAIAKDNMIVGIVQTYPPSPLTTHFPLSLGGMSVGAPTLPSPVHPQGPGGSPGLPPTVAQPPASGGNPPSNSFLGAPPPMAGGSPPPLANGGNPPSNSFLGASPPMAGGSLPPLANGGNPPLNRFLGPPPPMAGASPPPQPSANEGNPPPHHALTTPLGSPGGKGNTDSESPNTPPPSIQLPLSSPGNGTQATQPEGGDFESLLTPFSGPTPPILGGVTPPPSIILEASSPVIIPVKSSDQVTPLTDSGNSTPPAPVPEPSTLLLLSSGLGSYLIYRRKSKRVP